MEYVKSVIMDEKKLIAIREVISMHEVIGKVNVESEPIEDENFMVDFYVQAKEPKMQKTIFRAVEKTLTMLFD